MKKQGREHFRKKERTRPWGGKSRARPPYLKGAEGEQCKMSSAGRRGQMWFPSLRSRQELVGFG